jgi:hypothetical protein
MSRKVMAAILAHREVAPLLSDEHFSVDGTLAKAWASIKSFQPKADAAPPDDEGTGDPPASGATPETTPSETPAETDPMPHNPKVHRNAEVDFMGETRSNATHASITDPDARLYKKSPGTGAILCFMGHALMENRNGLIVQGDLTQADGHAERKAGLDMVHRHSPGSTRRLSAQAASRATRPEPGHDADDPRPLHRGRRSPRLPHLFRGEFAGARGRDRAGASVVCGPRHPLPGRFRKSPPAHRSREADETLIVATQDLAGKQRDHRDALRQLVLDCLPRDDRSEAAPHKEEALFHSI